MKWFDRCLFGLFGQTTIEWHSMGELTSRSECFTTGWSFPMHQQPVTRIQNEHNLMVKLHCSHVHKLEYCPIYLHFTRCLLSCKGLNATKIGGKIIYNREIWCNHREFTKFFRIVTLVLVNWSNALNFCQICQIHRRNLLDNQVSGHLCYFIANNFAKFH